MASALSIGIVDQLRAFIGSTQAPASQAADQVGGLYRIGALGSYSGQAWFYSRIVNSVYHNPTGKRCTDAIAAAFARAPLTCYAEGDKVRETPKASPLQALLDNPVPVGLTVPAVSGKAAARKRARDMTLAGMSLTLKVRGMSLTEGPITQLRRLPPQRVTVIGNEHDELLGFIYHDRLGRRMPLLPQWAVYERFPHPDRDYQPFPPALAAGLAAETDTKAAQFNLDLLQNDGAIPAVVMLEGLTPDRFSEWAEEWDAGADPGKVRFMGFTGTPSGGKSVEILKIGQTNEELAYDKLRDYSQEDIARALGCPPVVTFNMAHEALALDTLLPTPEGWTTVGNVQPGDVLFDDRGQQTRVRAVTPVYEGRPCYEVAFADGTKVVADEDHLWHSWTRGDLMRGYYTPVKPGVAPGAQLRTTGEMARLPLKDGRAWNLRVDVAAPVDLPERDLPLDPYVLGAWLGDGYSAFPTICGTKEDLTEIMAVVAERGYRLTEPKVQGNTWRQSFGVTRTHDERQATGAVATLRKMELLHAKRIPAEYLRASQSQRLELLQGLMDTDGGMAGTRCAFTTAKVGLAEQVRELVASLGMAPRVRRYVPTVRGIAVGEAYSVEFAPHLQVFKLSRKVAKCVVRPLADSRTRTRRRSIVSIRPVESVPVKCVEVDSPSHLFLCSRAFIPTHNTYANADREIKHWYSSTIWDYWDQCGDEMTSQLGSEYGVALGYAMGDIAELQESKDSMVARHMTLQQNQNMSINESNRRLGLPTVEWGDEPLVPVTVMQPMPPPVGGPAALPPPAEPAPDLAPAPVAPPPKAALPSFRRLTAGLAISPLPLRETAHGVGREAASEQRAVKRLSRYFDRQGHAVAKRLQAPGRSPEAVVRRGLFDGPRWNDELLEESRAVLSELTDHVDEGRAVAMVEAINAETLRDLEQVVSRGMAQGQSMDDIAAEVHRYFDGRDAAAIVKAEFEHLKETPNAN